MNAGHANTICVEWGRARFRAFLLDSDRRLIDRIVVNEGVNALARGHFHRAFRAHCGVWLSRYPDAEIVFCGALGGRNGWVDLPQVSVPASLADIALYAKPFDCGDGRLATAIPGLSWKSQSGMDLTQGEETLALGTGLKSGLVCIPGVHSKWIEIDQHVITGFASFLTGEAYELLARNMGSDPSYGAPDDSAFFRGLSTALHMEPSDANDTMQSLPFAAGPFFSARSGRLGLLHALFEARAGVMTGALEGRQVASFIAGVLIGDEMVCARRKFAERPVLNVVDRSPLFSLYQEAARIVGFDVNSLDGDTAFVNGVIQVTEHLRKSRTSEPPATEAAASPIKQLLPYGNI